MNFFSNGFYCLGEGIIAKVSIELTFNSIVLKGEIQLNPVITVNLRGYFQRRFHSYLYLLV